MRKIRDTLLLLLVASAGMLCTVVGAEPSAPIFTEVAAETGLDFVYFNGMSGEDYFPEMTGQGGA
ncbi:MAG: hypothetical protein AAF657_27670, partial [Acidobacteriota bacterium]